jgi:hypothetical protein
MLYVVQGRIQACVHSSYGRNRFTGMFGQISSKDMSYGNGLCLEIGRQSALSHVGFCLKGGLTAVV